jgi:phage shock protein PspC (stress-responsive transcriptional regulator)
MQYINLPPNPNQITYNNKAELEMKRIININLAGRLIPIEDSAYEQLKSYLDSLKRFFASEQGGEEIVGDIESRIAELFQDLLKKGAQCITDLDVQGVIASMGRPDQLADEPLADPGAHAGPTGAFSLPPFPTGKRLMRDEENKIIGGVCSGLAHYFNMDPVVARIIFVVFTMAWGSGILIYILLWALLPGNRRGGYNPARHKRLYRDPENKVLGGVCSGIGNYLTVDPVAIRIFFALPLLGIIFFSILDHMFSHNFFFAFSVGSFPTLILIYIVLWIAVPKAVTVTERLEMRGARVDLQNISNAVKEAAEERKPDPGAAAAPVNPLSSPYTAPNYYPPITSRRRSTLGDIIVLMLKIFAFIILGIILVGLCIALISVAGAFFGVAGATSVILPYNGMLLTTPAEHRLAIPAIYLTLGIPVVAILWYFIRLITGFRPRRRVVGPVLGTLWFAGFVCAVLLVISIVRDFQMDYRDTAPVVITQPTSNRLVLRRADDDEEVSGFNLMGNFIRLEDDTTVIEDVKIDIEKSDADTFRVMLEKGSEGLTVDQARVSARDITYIISQSDSVLNLPSGIFIPRRDQFRNQRVRIKIYVPVGKDIRVEGGFNDVSWHNGDDYFNDNREQDFHMTPDGPKDLNHARDEDNNGDTDQTQDSVSSPQQTPPQQMPQSAPYKYKKHRGAILKDSISAFSGTSLNSEHMSLVFQGAC